MISLQSLNGLMDQSLRTALVPAKRTRNLYYDYLLRLGQDKCKGFRFCPFLFGGFAFIALRSNPACLLAYIIASSCLRKHVLSDKNLNRPFFS
jgi:hypothetical protein